MKQILEETDWNFPHSNKKSSIHSLHPYPAKFIPEIPRQLIHLLGVEEGTCVFDPFCGSGTTLIEAQNAGHRSIGVDLNPIACLASRVKTSVLNSNFQDYVELVINQAKSDITHGPDIDIPNVDHWFNKDIQHVLFSLTESIKDIEDILIREALELSLSSVIVRVSNQDSDTRYAAVEKNIKPEDVYTYFKKSSKKVADTLIPLKQNIEAKVIHKSILDVKQGEIDTPVSLVITSPPYPNAYEYWLYHKYRMYWLGYDPKAVKVDEIGARAHYFKKNHETIDDFKEQMRKVLTLINSVTISGANICFVVGRSKIHGKEYQNHLIIKEIGKELGMTHIHTLVREISSSRKSFNLSHAEIKKEQIVILRKP